MDKFSDFISEQKNEQPYKLLILVHSTPEDPNKTGVIIDKESKKIDGVEVYYPGYSASTRDSLLGLLSDNDLMASGGSDFHGENKPNNLLGIGYENNPIKVPLNLLYEMEDAHAKL